MTLTILTLISALSISATAAYFSIIGLATMFPGSKEAIILMGVVLEIGKIIAAIWLHSNWKELSKVLRTYLLFSVIVLMLITSMGIFGFLSKSYIVHEAESDKELAQISQIDNQIKREKELIQNYEDSIVKSEKKESSSSQTKVNFIEIEEARIGKISEIAKQSISVNTENIKRWRQRLQVLDEAINLIESKSGLFSSSKKKAEALKEEQKEEREDLKVKISQGEDRIQLTQEEMQSNIREIQNKIKDFQDAVINSTTENDSSKNIQLLINDSQKNIDDFEIQKFDMQKRVRELEVEVGPVKYIVELFGDLGKKDIGLGTAVRLVIIALIFVFDPLAVILVVVSVGQFKKKTTKNEKQKDNLIKAKREDETLKENQMQELSEEISKINKKIKDSSVKKNFKTVDTSNINWSE